MSAGAEFSPTYSTHNRVSTASTMSLVFRRNGAIALPGAKLSASVSLAVCRKLRAARAGLVSSVRKASKGGMDPSGSASEVEGFILPPGEHLATRVRYNDGVLPLCGKPAISRGHGPAVSRIQLGVALARIDHRFHRKGHTRL